MGRTYFDFMEEENLSADGLVAASQDWDSDPVPPDMQFYRERMRDAHDLTHTITGYGRDPLGRIVPAGLHVCPFAQSGHGLHRRHELAAPAQPAKAAVREAWQNGKKARWMQDMDWEALLPRTLADVRRECAIADPAAYRAAMA